MNEADLLKIAEEAGFAVFHGIIGATKWSEWIQINDELKHFAGLVAQREREKCAIQIIQDINTPDFLASQEARAGWNVAKQMILEAIQDKTDRANQKCEGQSHD